MENKRDLDISGLGNKRRVKSYSLSIHMYGDQLKYNLLVPLIIMLLLLKIQLEKIRFIALDRNMMCLILLRSGKLWLRMRQEKFEMSHI